eukprot:6211902-Pleurochrysis_carterae.AAC.1
MGELAQRSRAEIRTKCARGRRGETQKRASLRASQRVRASKANLEERPAACSATGVKPRKL